MKDLKLELKKQVIEALNLSDIRPEDIGDDTPLFGEGLGLDSIDALELVVILEQFHGIQISDESVGKEVLHSIATMAAHITAENAKKPITNQPITNQP